MTSTNLLTLGLASWPKWWNGVVAEVVPPGLVPEHLDERRQRQRPAAGGGGAGDRGRLGLRLRVRLLAAGLGALLVAMAAAMAGEVDAQRLDRATDDPQEGGAGAGAGSGSGWRLRVSGPVLLVLLVLLGAVPDLLLGLVDQAAAVARVRDHGEEAAVGDLRHEFREVLICSAGARTLERS